MRFKGTIACSEAIIRTLKSLSHMAKECLVVLCERNWKFHISEKFVQSSNPQCYASTPIAYVFSHYQIESLSANNEILLQCNIKSLLQAFKTTASRSVRMSICKLTKKHGIATLSFELWEDDGDELRVEIIQDVSVQVVQHSKLYMFEEPDLGQFHASSYLPPLKSLKTVAERMASIEKMARLYIDSKDGRFLLQIKTQHCALKTIYRNLNFDSAQKRKKTASAQIDLKYFIKVLSALNGLECKQTLIAITRKLAVTIHARLKYANCNDNNDEMDEEREELNDDNSARVTFYLCVFINDDDESDDDDDDDEESESEKEQKEKESDDEDDSEEDME